jgi:hypothetical protein
LEVHSTAERVRRAERVAWYICVATLAGWALTYVAWPFSNDQGNLAWVGDVVLGGGMPYRDAWDVKGPAAHLLFALVQATFGRNEWGLRLFDLVKLAAGALCLRRIVQTYATRSAAAWAIALFVLWYASLNHHSTAQPDGWAGVMLAAVVATLVARERIRVSQGVIAGALIGICVLIKPTYVLFLALPLIAGLARLRSESLGPVVRFALATGVGFATPVALCIAWFASRGALDDWMAVQLQWIPTAYTKLDAAWFSRLQYLATFLTTEQFAPALPLVVGGLALVRQRSPAAALLLLTWAAAAGGGVLIQGQFYAYHWLPIYPALAALGGLGLDVLVTWLRTPPSRSASATDDLAARWIMMATAAAVAIVVLAGAELQPALHLYRYAKSLVSADGKVNHDRVEFGPFGHHGGVFPELVAYLRVNTRPNETLMVWGSVAGINYLSARAAPSPFGFVQPLVEPPDTELRRRYRNELISRLTITPPRYVVSLNRTACERAPSWDERQLMGKAEGLMRCIDDLPLVAAFVHGRYELERAIGPLDLWRLRDETSARSPASGRWRSASPVVAPAPARPVTR